MIFPLHVLLLKIEIDCRTKRFGLSGHTYKIVHEL